MAIEDVAGKEVDLGSSEEAFEASPCLGTAIGAVEKRRTILLFVTVYIIYEALYLEQASNVVMGHPMGPSFCQKDCRLSHR